MPILTGDTFVAKDQRRYVIDTSGAEGNPIRGIYHSSYPWTQNNNQAPSYLQDGAVSAHHMVSESIVSVPLTLAENSKRTLYQSLIDRSESPDFEQGNILEGVAVSDLTYSWQMRKHFHEFCMQYDKYEPIDLIHFTQNPADYDMLVWRNDRKQFQRILPSQIIAAFVQDGINGQIALGSLTELDYDPANSALFPEADPNPADLNGDGSVSTADLLEFLTVYGTPLNPTNTPSPSTTPSIYKITYSDDDVANPPIPINHYVVGADGGPGNLLTDPNFSAALGDNDELIDQFPYIQPGEVAFDYPYEMGHPVTVPTQAFPDIPLDGDITIDSTSFFGVGNVVIARPNTQGIGDMSYDDLHSFQFSDIDKSGAFSNNFKVIRVEVDVQAFTTSTDLLHLAMRGSYTRPNSQSNGQQALAKFAGSTWGGDPTIDTNISGAISFSDYQPVVYGSAMAAQEGGEIFSPVHKSLQVYPNYFGPDGEVITQTLHGLVATPLSASLQPGEEGYDSSGANTYLSNTYSISVTPPAVVPPNGVGLTMPNPDNPDGIPFYGNKNILLIRSGINNTEDIKISLGFYSQFGNVSSIKIKEVRFLIHPGGF